MIINETWKPVKYYEEDYEVSDLGRVRSLTFRGGYGSSKRHFPHILKPHLKKRGKNPSKLEIRLWRSQKPTSKYIDSLVLKTFVGECPINCNQAVHKDNDQLNCKLNNLRWGQQSLHQKQPWSISKSKGNPEKKLYGLSNMTNRERKLQYLRNIE